MLRPAAVTLGGAPVVTVTFGVGVARFEMGVLDGSGVLCPVVFTAPEPEDRLNMPNATEMTTITPSTINSRFRRFLRPFGRWFFGNGGCIVDSIISGWSLLCSTLYGGSLLCSFGSRRSLLF